MQKHTRKKSTNITNKFDKNKHKNTDKNNSIVMAIVNKSKTLDWIIIPLCPVGQRVLLFTDLMNDIPKISAGGLENR